MVYAREHQIGRARNQAIDAQFDAIDRGSLNGIGLDVSKAHCLTGAQLVHDGKGVTLTRIAAIGSHDHNVGITLGHKSQGLDARRTNAIVVGYHNKRAHLVFHFVFNMCVQRHAGSMLCHTGRHPT